MSSAQPRSRTRACYHARVPQDAQASGGPDDAELLAAWRLGDEAAARELLARYFPILYRFFRNKIDGDIDDLIQSTLVACARNHAQVRSSFRAWLLTVARHELYAHLRKRHAKLDDVPLDVVHHNVIDTGTSPSMAARRSQRGRLLVAALRRIPIELQLALELHYWEDLSTAEMAEVLDIPQGTVKSRLRRGRSALEVALHEVEAAPADRDATLQNLESWARDLREGLDPSAGE